MLISSAANAGQAVTPGNDTRFYDDIGCLAADAAVLKPDAHVFVQLANGAGWAPAGSAWFAASSGVRTPMAYGLAAFASEAEARRADGKGIALRWEDIVGRAGGR